MTNSRRDTRTNCLRMEGKQVPDARNNSTCADFFPVDGVTARKRSNTSRWLYSTVDLEVFVFTQGRILPPSHRLFKPEVAGIQKKTGQVTDTTIAIPHRFFSDKLGGVQISLCHSIPKPRKRPTGPPHPELLRFGDRMWNEI